MLSGMPDAKDTPGASAPLGRGECGLFPGAFQPIWPETTFGFFRQGLGAWTALSAAVKEPRILAVVAIAPWLGGGPMPIPDLAKQVKWPT